MKNVTGVAGTEKVFLKLFPNIYLAKIHDLLSGTT